MGCIAKSDGSDSDLTNTLILDGIAGVADFRRAAFAAALAICETLLLFLTEALRFSAGFGAGSLGSSSLSGEASCKYSLAGFSATSTAAAATAAGFFSLLVTTNSSSSSSSLSSSLSE